MVKLLDTATCLSVQKKLLEKDLAILSLKDDGSKAKQFIPVAGAVLSIPGHQWANYVNDGHMILQAARKIVRVLISEDRKDLMNGCSDEELWFAWQHGPQPLASVRFDGVLGKSWKDFQFIELNTTIPAMSAYADMTQSCYPSCYNFVSHSENLRRSLMSFYNLHSGLKDRPSILIVSRKSDAQSAELEYLQKTWSSQGHYVALVSEDEIELSEDKVIANGESFDLVYRHIFISRLKTGSPFMNACLDWSRYRIANPPAVALEVKSLFAYLSASADDLSLQKKFHLVDPEIRAIRRRIPWTRIWTEKTDLYEADVDSETRGKILKDPTGFIIKKNRSFGGRSTIFGTDSRPFLEALLPTEKDLWIVQKSLLLERTFMQRITCEGVEKENDFYIDLGIFMNSDIPLRVAGPVGRFSKNPAVNLGLGGGILPCVIEPVT